MTSERSRTRTLVPVRYSAWLAGDLGRKVEARFRACLSTLPDLRVSRLPRALLIESNQTGPVQLEAALAAIVALQNDLAREYPVFWHQMGPLWTGSLQTIYGEVPA